MVEMMHEFSDRREESTINKTEIVINNQINWIDSKYQ